MPLPHSFDYCSSVVTFGSGKYYYSNCVLFFKIVLAIQSTMQSHMNLRISFSISVEEAAGNLTRIKLIL